MMASSGPQLTLLQEQANYRPGETLTGTFFVGPCDLEEVRSVELSILWQTEGKGDEDMAVHYFQRFEPSSVEWRELGQPLPFSSRLPNSPLSYDGVIVKIRWYVRLRVFLRRGKELIEEIPFQLGTVPATEVVSP